MHVRSCLNRWLIPRGYELVKSLHSNCRFHGSPIVVHDGRSRIALPDRKHAWLVAAPKSGSTWLTAILSQLLGWQVIPLVSASDRREQEIQIPSTLLETRQNVFSPQQHCRFSAPTLEFIEQFHVMPIITTRNIFDCIVSLRDHLLNESFIWPLAYVDHQFLQLNEEKQFDMVIATFLPWYFNFYAGWFAEETAAKVDRLIVPYERLVSDASATLKNILNFIGETRSEAEITAALEFSKTQFTRKNKGVSGRGELFLNERQKDRVREFREFYPRIDFSSVGL